MSWLQVLSLAVIQGLTEFLPVSSSGHLRAMERWFGMQGPQTAFDVTLHLGTLVSVLVYFLRNDRKELLDLVLLRRPRLAMLVIVATIPTGILGLTIGRWAETELSHLAWVGGAFLVTAGLLWSTRGRALHGGREEPGVVDALIVGVAQGIGVFRGVSRSGITIATGLHRGLDREAAFRFSFFLSIPAILGAFVLEARHLDGSGVEPLPLAVGFVVAALTGYAALAMLRRFVVRGGFHHFAWYLLVIGGLVIGTSLM